MRRAYRLRSPAEVTALVAEYESSGLRPSEFCRQKGMNRMTLQAYQLRQRKAPGETASGKRWLAVEVSGGNSVEVGRGASGLAVLLPGGCRIEISREFDADTLKRLLAVVERS
jgi:hypothetical protein